jgi:hypothetical protein
MMTEQEMYQWFLDHDRRLWETGDGAPAQRLYLITDKVAPPGPGALPVYRAFLSRGDVLAFIESYG